MDLKQSLSASISSSSSESEEAELRDRIENKLVDALGKNRRTATDHDWYQSTALAIRDRLVDIAISTSAETRRLKKKQVYYLSIEFLIGRLLFDTLTNLRIVEPTRRALASFGVDLERLRGIEPDAALGNGGLGRLAACFMDSLSALHIPAVGYGIRYQHGLFEQRIRNGYQEEYPENWLAQGNPWEFERSSPKYSIGFGGTVEYVGGADAAARAIWYPSETVLAVPFDTPIAGWRGRHVNLLRLWAARSAEPIQLAAFNQDNHVGASAARIRAEAISNVLYPNDATREGQELRLRQEYFFTSASLQDLTQRHLEQFDSLESLADYAAVQLNDTHPAIAVAELMRLLVDVYDFSWVKAWTITRATLSYTNHTLLPEALEKWPTALLGRLLPRHLQIIYLINWLHLETVQNRGLTEPRFLADVSLIQEDEDKSVRMGHLAFIGSHCVNGVSKLHTDLLGQTVFHDLAKTAPTRIVNKTNGISFRRWLYEANVPLTELLVATLGESVLNEPKRLQELEGKADDGAFVSRYAQARMENKRRLIRMLCNSTGLEVRPDALFDVHIKRIHEYKRQLLNILEIIAVYQHIRAQPDAPWIPRVKIFAGKAAPSYDRAKLIIKLMNDVARVVNNDVVVANRLKIMFVPNYGASTAEEIVPAADISEQISTAGMEASGTGNMKLALNGAITIGTLDGANIEIRDRVGEDNVVIFGLEANEVTRRKREHFAGRDAVAMSPRLAAVIDSLSSGEFSPEEPNRFAPIVQSLLDYDRFMVAADFDSYWEAQRKLDHLWQSPRAWWRACILNTARMSWFSSDRAIAEYAQDIWHVPCG